MVLTKMSFRYLTLAIAGSALSRRRFLQQMRQNPIIIIHIPILQIKALKLRQINISVVPSLFHVIRRWTVIRSSAAERRPRLMQHHSSRQDSHLQADLRLRTAHLFSSPTTFLHVAAYEFSLQPVCAWFSFNDLLHTVIRSFRRLGLPAALDGIIITVNIWLTIA